MSSFIEARVSPRAFYPAAIATEILRRVAGGEPLACICAEDGMPSRGSFYNWITDDPLLSARYADAVRESVVNRVTK
jgi:hypothetical protein